MGSGDKKGWSTQAKETPSCWEDQGPLARVIIGLYQIGKQGEGGHGIIEKGSLDEERKPRLEWVGPRGLLHRTEDLAKAVLVIRMDRPLSDSPVSWVSQKLVLGGSVFPKGHPSASVSPRHMGKCLPRVEKSKPMLQIVWGPAPQSVPEQPASSEITLCFSKTGLLSV